MSENALKIGSLQAAILAGGEGVRLRSAVNDRPKALASIAGRPFIDWMLSELCSQGVRRVVLCTGYLASMLRDYVSDGQRWNMQVTYSEEHQPLGTGGALRNALPAIDSDPVLVLNGDSLCRVDLGLFLAWHRQQPSRASIVVARVNDCSRFGTVELDDRSAIQRFLEKNSSSAPGWINAGVYLFDRAVINSITPGQPRSLEHELFPALTKEGLSGYRVTTPFVDIGTPESYVQSQSFFPRTFASAATGEAQ